jgi:hypothetical protein
MRSHVDVTYLHEPPFPISVSEEVWAYVTSLAQPRSTEVPVSDQERELSRISVVCVSIVPFCSGSGGVMLRHFSSIFPTYNIYGSSCYFWLGVQ